MNTKAIEINKQIRLTVAAFLFLLCTLCETSFAFLCQCEVEQWVGKENGVNRFVPVYRLGSEYVYDKRENKLYIPGIKTVVIEISANALRGDCELVSAWQPERYLRDYTLYKPKGTFSDDYPGVPEFEEVKSDLNITKCKNENRWTDKFDELEPERFYFRDEVKSLENLWKEEQE